MRSSPPPPFIWQSRVSAQKSLQTLNKLKEDIIVLLFTCVLKYTFFFKEHKSSNYPKFKDKLREQQSPQLIAHHCLALINIELEEYD